MVESLSIVLLAVSAFSVLQCENYFYNVFKWRGWVMKTVDESEDILTATCIFPEYWPIVFGCILLYIPLKSFI